MNTITAKNLTKRIGRSTVLNEINLTLSGGNVYAFQGENGCGKTMLFRVLSGLSKPTSGEVLFNDVNINTKHEQLFKIGIVIENSSLFPQFTGVQNLTYLAKINSLIGKAEIENALVRVGLDPADRRTVRKYSLGMRQRLMIAQAIMEQPDFLFLDEPTNAIDRDGVKMVYDIVRSEAQRGAVVMLATHLEQDVSALANRRFIMEKGVIVDEK